MAFINLLPRKDAPSRSGGGRYKGPFTRTSECARHAPPREISVCRQRGEGIAECCWQPVRNGEHAPRVGRKAHPSPFYQATLFCTETVAFQAPVAFIAQKGWRWECHGRTPGIAAPPKRVKDTRRPEVHCSKTMPPRRQKTHPFYFPTKYRGRSRRVARFPGTR